MFKSKTKFIILLVSFILLFSTLSFATELTTTNENSGSTSNIAEINNTNRTDSDLYEMTESLVVDKDVNGNAFIMAREVTIKSTINGDAFIMAERITLDNCLIDGNLFAMANDIKISGSVRDSFVFANTITIEDSGIISRDLKASSNIINISGKIGRNASLMCANYSFKTNGGTLIEGDLNYVAESKLDISQDLVAGKINFTEQKVHKVTVAERIKNHIIDSLNNIVYIVVVIALLIWLAPNFSKKIVNSNGSKVVISAGVGLLTFILVIIIAIAFIISSLFIKAAFSLIMLLVVLCISGSAIASLYFAGLIVNRFKLEGNLPFILSGFAAAIIIWVIKFIPVIGDLVYLFTVLLGMGLFMCNILPSHNNKEVSQESKAEK